MRQEAPLIHLFVRNVSREFGEMRVLRDISFDAQSGQAIAIIGPNGSGKTTLIRILSYLIKPTSGEVVYQDGEQRIRPEKIHKFIGLVGPYLEMYQDLTAAENLRFFAEIQGMKHAEPRIRELMELLGLGDRLDDAVKTYSSGMKQRLKYVFALLNHPQILFVDEPRSNLDEQGIQTVYRLLREFKEKNLLIIATNEKEDLHLADKTVQVHA